MLFSQIGKKTLYKFFLRAENFSNVFFNKAKKTEKNMICVIFPREEKNIYYYVIYIAFFPVGQRGKEVVR